jgi:hypothetical protein
MRGRFARLAPLSGLVFVVLVVIAFFAFPSSPNVGASAAKSVSFFAAHRRSQLAIAFFVWYAMLFAVIFGAVLRMHLRNRGGSGVPADLGFAGMVFFAVAFSVAAAFLYAAADVATKISPSAEQALNVLQNDIFPVFLVGIAILMLGNGLAIVRAREKPLPAWLGWVALVIALVAVVPFISFFAVFAFLIWMLIVSVLIFLRQGKTGSEQALVASA